MPDFATTSGKRQSRWRRFEPRFINGYDKPFHTFLIALERKFKCLSLSEFQIRQLSRVTKGSNLFSPVMNDSRCW
jgi:hypothetical protein